MCAIGSPGQERFPYPSAMTFSSRMNFPSDEMNLSGIGFALVIEAIEAIFQKGIDLFVRQSRHWQHPKAAFSVQLSMQTSLPAHHYRLFRRLLIPDDILLLLDDQNGDGRTEGSTNYHLL